MSVNYLNAFVRSIFQIEVVLMFSFESLSFYEYQHNSIVCQTFFFIYFIVSFFFIHSGKINSQIEAIQCNAESMIYNVQCTAVHWTPNTVCIPFISCIQNCLWILAECLHLFYRWTPTHFFLLFFFSSSDSFVIFLSLYSTLIRLNCRPACGLSLCRLKWRKLLRTFVTINV